MPCEATDSPHAGVVVQGRGRRVAIPGMSESTDEPKMTGLDSGCFWVSGVVVAHRRASMRWVSRIAHCSLIARGFLATFYSLW